MIGGLLWVPWIRFQPSARAATGRSRTSGLLPSRAACPHCTNVDTLSLHCRDNRCGWASCTCGALIYSNRRHRHPRHRSDTDTCHDPAAAL